MRQRPCSAWSSLPSQRASVLRLVGAARRLLEQRAEPRVQRRRRGDRARRPAVPLGDLALALLQRHPLVLDVAHALRVDVDVGLPLDGSAGSAASTAAARAPRARAPPPSPLEQRGGVETAPPRGDGGRRARGRRAGSLAARFCLCVLCADERGVLEEGAELSADFEDEGIVGDTRSVRPARQRRNSSAASAGAVAAPPSAISGAIGSSCEKLLRAAMLDKPSNWCWDVRHSTHYSRKHRRASRLARSRAPRSHRALACVVAIPRRPPATLGALGYRPYSDDPPVCRARRRFDGGRSNRSGAPPPCRARRRRRPLHLFGAGAVRARAAALSLAGVRAHVALSGLCTQLLRLAPPPAERALDALLRSLDSVDEVARRALQLLAAPLQLLAGLAVLASRWARSRSAAVALGALAHGALQLLAAATFLEQQLQSARADRLALLDQLLPRTESDEAPRHLDPRRAGPAAAPPRARRTRCSCVSRTHAASSPRRIRCAARAPSSPPCTGRAGGGGGVLGARALSAGRATRLPSAAIVLLLAHWLRGPALALPAALHAVRDAAAAVAAAHAFLALPDRAVVGIGALRAVGVAIDGADFGGPSSAAVLRGVDVRASAGQLVGVAGTDADGAPLVVQALCGGLPLKSGSLALRGRVALVPRLPLIVPGSLRANVEFGLPHDPQRFERAVSSCGLLTADDLASLPAGDLTPVRAAGASTPDGADDALELSQAQALRVALARAVYSRRTSSWSTIRSRRCRRPRRPRRRACSRCSASAVPSAARCASWRPRGPSSWGASAVLVLRGRGGGERDARSSRLTAAAMGAPRRRRQRHRRRGRGGAAAAAAAAAAVAATGGDDCTLHAAGGSGPLQPSPSTLPPSAERCRRCRCRRPSPRRRRSRASLGPPPSCAPRGSPSSAAARARAGGRRARRRRAAQLGAGWYVLAAVRRPGELPALLVAVGAASAAAAPRARAPSLGAAAGVTLHDDLLGALARAPRAAARAAPRAALVGGFGGDLRTFEHAARRTPPTPPASAPPPPPPPSARWSRRRRYCSPSSRSHSTPLARSGSTPPPAASSAGDCGSARRVDRARAAHAAASPPSPPSTLAASSPPRRRSPRRSGRRARGGGGRAALGARARRRPRRPLGWRWRSASSRARRGRRLPPRRRRRRRRRRRARARRAPRVVGGGAAGGGARAHGPALERVSAVRRAWRRGGVGRYRLLYGRNHQLTRARRHARVLLRDVIPEDARGPGQRSGRGGGWGRGLVCTSLAARWRGGGVAGEGKGVREWGVGPAPLMRARCPALRRTRARARAAALRPAPSSAAGRRCAPSTPR